jgi:hypothetical protein
MAMDGIGIVRPLKHSQRGPARVLPAFDAGNFFFGRPMKPLLSLFIGKKFLKKRPEAVRTQN